MNAVTQEVVCDIPAIVQEVVVTTGSRVSSGDTLVVLEAMKMEIPVFAEADALVEDVHVHAGEPVREGQAVVTLAT